MSRYRETAFAADAGRAAWLDGVITADFHRHGTDMTGFRSMIHRLTEGKFL